MRHVYLDHAATTPLDIEVERAMDPFWRESFGNPGGIYQEGVKAKQAITHAREVISNAINARPDEIIFTSGGTEGNNLSLVGFVNWLEREGYDLSKLHAMTSVIEHPSVLDCFHEFERRGMDISIIGVTSDGVLDMDEFKASLKETTVLISVMQANNEIGVFQPLSHIAKILRDRRAKNFFRIPAPHAEMKYGELEFPHFNTDSSQAALLSKIDVKAFGVDSLVLDAQKIYGPKGVGAIFLRRGTPLCPLFFGGKQEKGLRPGTENVPGIVGFGKAMEIVMMRRERDSKELTELRDYFITLIEEKIPGASLNGDRKNRLSNNVNFSFPGMEKEWMVLSLDAKGISVATRSACLSEDTRGSYVVEALKKGKEYALSPLRFTLGRDTKKEDLLYTVEVLQETMAQKMATAKSQTTSV